MENSFSPKIQIRFAKKKIIYIFSSTNIFMVEMKNSLVRDLPGIYLHSGRLGIWFLHTTDTLKGQIELNLIPEERALLPGGG
jgi:hypothetical protein